jgi:acid phosphatase (class A)
MNMSGVFRFGRSASLTAAHSLLLAVGLCLAASSVYAQERYIGVGQPDGRLLLPPPPAPGSAEELADLASVRAVSKARTPEEEARAVKDASLSFTLFVDATGPVFDLAKLPKTDALLQKVKKEVGETVDIPKDHWKRARPYVSDPTILFGRPERSLSYPSGHSMRGMLYALVIAELFPDKKEEIIDIGLHIGWGRVLIGKHYPTDVFAGRVLAIATMRELLANGDFQRDLAAAKTEVEAARAAWARTDAPMLQTAN